MLVRLLYTVAISLGIILLIALPAYGSNSFSVSGKVIDALGNPVQGANVTLVDNNNKNVSSVQTSSTGCYDFVNMASDTSTVTVRVNLTRDGVTYEIPAYYTRWYSAKGIQVINSSETQFPDYPPPTEGYVVGRLETNATQFAELLDGDVYLVSVDGKAQYHERTVTENSLSGPYFKFHVPAGSYEIYAVHNESGIQYASGHERIDVAPAWKETSAMATMLIVDKSNGMVIPPTPTPILPTPTPVPPTPTPTMNTTAGIMPQISMKTVAGVAAGGVAVTSIGYAIIKFFGVGAVARAKDRLGKNDNRNKLLKYIADNPGVTLHELSHSLGMNLGTVRYHLFILGLNHCIVSTKFDDKFVRYFTNSGSYTRDEQLVMSLVRRETVRKLLGALLEKPGQSNVELSKQLNMHDNAISRYIKELLKWDIVVKEPMAGGTSTYSIRKEYRGTVATMLERIGNAKL